MVEKAYVCILRESIFAIKIVSDQESVRTKKRVPD